MNPADKALYGILSEFNRMGILDHLVVIGGWCHRLYRIYFSDPIELTVLTTFDVDFIVNDPDSIPVVVNIKEELEKLGFREEFKGSAGINKYLREDLEIEFLSVQTSERDSARRYIKKLNTNAQSLKFLGILTDHTLKVNFHGINVLVPEPASFVFNKILILEKRKVREKKEKDLVMITDLVRFLLKTPEGRDNLKAIFQELSPGEKEKIRRITQKYHLKFSEIISDII